MFNIKKKLQNAWYEGRKEGRKGENGNSGIKFWVTIGGRSDRSISSPATPRCNLRGSLLHSACIRGHHPDTRFPIIIVFKSGIVGHASSPIYFVVGRARSREGVSRKSVTVPCADRFRHLLRGSNHDRVIIFLDFDWNTWRDRRSRTLLSLSLVWFSFALGFIDDSRFDPISGCF